MNLVLAILVGFNTSKPGNVQVLVVVLKDGHVVDVFGNREQPHVVQDDVRLARASVFPAHFVDVGSGAPLTRAPAPVERRPPAAPAPAKAPRSARPATRARRP
eukprot:3294272-Prymnesium_polylepis.1